MKPVTVSKTAASHPFTPAWMTAAFHEMGVSETPGSVSNKRILEYRKMAQTPLDGDDGVVPWCAIFVNAMLESVGVKGTRSAAARGAIGHKDFIKIDSPVYGSICVLNRPGSAWMGHTGFVTGYADGFVELLNGNASDMVRISKFPKSRVLGYYWPKGQKVPPFVTVALGGAQLTNGNEA